MGTLIPPSPTQRIVEVLLAAAAVLVLSGLGCATAPPPPPLPAWVGAGAEDPSAPLSHPALHDSVAGRNESADFVVSALQGTGLRFGTDGSARSLWGYMKEAQHTIAPHEARRGDVLFFNVRGPGDPFRGAAGLEEGCADHVALVWNREPDGRIVFVEIRDRRKRMGYVFPPQPWQRRARDGRVLNTFLRTKRPQDPREARYLAGEMLCGVARATP